MQFLLKKPSRQEKYFLKNWQKDMHSGYRFDEAHVELAQVVKSYLSRLFCLTIPFHINVWNLMVFLI